MERRLLRKDELPHLGSLGHLGKGRGIALPGLLHAFADALFEGAHDPLLLAGAHGEIIPSGSEASLAERTRYLMDLKVKLEQIQQVAGQLLQQRQALQERLQAVGNDLLRLEGQAALIVEIDPSLAPQGPQPVNPDAHKHPAAITPNTEPSELDLTDEQRATLPKLVPDQDSGENALAVGISPQPECEVA